MKSESPAEKAVSVFPHNIPYVSSGLKIGCAEFAIEKPGDGQRALQVLDQFFWIRVMEGRIRFEINMQEVYVDKGETLFINCRVPHVYRGVVEVPSTVRVLCAAPDALQAPFLEKQLEDLISDDGFASTVIRPASPLFSYESDAIAELIRHKPEAYEFEIAAKYLSLLRKYCRIHAHTSPDDTVSRDVDVEALREMLAYIGEHHQEELTVDEIAAAGRMSRSKCTRLFRRHLGKSPIEHVQQYRLEKSVHLLKNTTLQFAEIAAMCGFNQQSYFNRLFVREYDMTPRQMRRSVQNTGTQE